jgi:outer membrane receptor protein involved in Fe transport
MGKPMALKALLFNRALLLTTFLISPQIAFAQEPVPAQNPADQPPEDDADTDSDVVVVLGKFIPEPMRETSEVASFLSSEDLARTGDDNAAAALTRLTGLSVVQGRFVYVRGLGDRYSSALLNGSPLPSPEPLRRQVPLDLFPSNILDGATVQKTYSPNYPGEFGGGIIDLKTLRIPVYPFLNTKVGTAWSTESTYRRGTVYRGSDLDWLGIDDHVRPIPGALTWAVNQNLQITDANFSDDELEMVGESLANSPVNVLFAEDLLPDFELEATAGTALDGDDYTLGLVGVIGYENSWRTRRAHREEVVGNALTTDMRTNTTVGDVVLNAFASASLDMTDHNITASGLLVRSTSKYAQIEQGVDFDAPGADLGENVRTEATAWYERQLGSFQLAGEHTFDALQLDWRTAFARSTRSAPYEREIRYDIVNGTPIFGGGGGLGNRIRFSQLADEVASAGFDAAYTLPIGESRDAVISAGVVYSNSIRDFKLLQFAWTGPRGFTPNDVLTARVDYLLSPDNIDPNRFVLNEFTGPDDSYKGRLTNMGAYVAADIEVIPLVRASVGVRYEDTVEEVRTYNRFGLPSATPVSLSNEYWLPAATVTWNFAEDLQLRLGYSQTIARPQFRELARTPFIDPDTDRVYEGNPFLVDTEFTNYDARVEYYFDEGQFVTLGAFYKEVVNPIEEVVIRVDRYQTRFINAPKATLAGAEFEYKVLFDMPFSFGVLDDAKWLFQTNYTYTKSEVVAGPGTTVISPITFLPVPSSFFELDGTQLQGSPEHILNAQFGYETPYSQMTLILGWTDDRILRRGQGSVEPVYDHSGINVDLVYKHTLEWGENDLTLTLAGRNLGGAVYEEYQIYDRGRNEVDRYPRGQIFSASIAAEF